MQTSRFNIKVKWLPHLCLFVVKLVIEGAQLIFSEKDLSETILLVLAVILEFGCNAISISSKVKFG